MPAQTRFPRLLEPGWIGNVRLKNRIIKAPQHTGLANPDGSITERLLRYYRTVARAAPAMVIVEYAWVDTDASQASPCQLGIGEHRPPARLSLLAQTIQANGAKAAIQISHAGRQRFTLEQPKAASPVPWEEIYARRLPRPQGAHLRRDPGDREGLRPGRQAGPDGRLRHGRAPRLPRLPHLELPLPAHQQARPTGTAARSRTACASCSRWSAEIKRQVGPSYPDLRPRERHRLRAGRPRPSRRPSSSASASRPWESPPSTCPAATTTQTIHEVSPMGMSLAHNVWAAEAVKKEVWIPVIASGSITQPDLAESILADGKGDFIGLGRPLWADPEWPAQGEGRPAGGHPALHPLQRRLPGPRRPHRQHHLVHGQRRALPRGRVRDHAGRHPEEGGGGRRRTGRHGGRAGLRAQRPRGDALRETGAGRRADRGLHPGVQGARPRAADPLPEDAGEEARHQGGRKEATAEEISDGGYDAVIVATGATLGLEDVPGINCPKVTTRWTCCTARPARDRRWPSSAAGSWGPRSAWSSPSRARR